MAERPRYWVHEEGATAVEYGIMIALIAAVIVLVVIVLGQQTRGAYCEVSENFSAAPSISDPSDDCA